MRLYLYLLFGSLSLASSAAPFMEAKPADPYFKNFRLLRAPSSFQLSLKPGNRLAICGDSITEQARYSRLMEDYLTMCTPQLRIAVRQYGWAGERVPGFLTRMTNDCLRFKPTIATTCYGMNDSTYHPYNDQIGKIYEDSSRAMIKVFKAHGMGQKTSAKGRFSCSASFTPIFRSSHKLTFNSSTVPDGVPQYGILLTLLGQPSTPIDFPLSFPAPGL